MTGVAREAGISRESLYRALSTDGNPEIRHRAAAFCAPLDCNSPRIPVQQRKSA